MSQNYADGDAGGDAGGGGDGESMASYNEARPAFYIGQHDSTRTETLTDMQYGLVLVKLRSSIITDLSGADVILSSVL